MKGSLRQSMTWLHTWSSIIAGWLLFAIFFTGTLAFFRVEITHWMTPEIHTSFPNKNSVEVAYNYLTENAEQAKTWQITLPNQRARTLGLSWQNPGQKQERRRGPRVIVDASSGEEISPRETAGGNFLYRFHFMFYGLPRDIAYTMVGFVSMLMLVGLISGIIMHRKIFTDFFSFRPKKKLLTWIDGHAITAVLALPFHLMITFSGIILLGSVLLPWNGTIEHKGSNNITHDKNNRQVERVIEKDFSAQPPFGDMIAYAQSRWKTDVTSITITAPGTAKASYELRGNNRETLSSGRSGSSTITFNHQGDEIKTKPGTEASNTAQAIYNYLDMLHQARFADNLTRWLLFLAGILGTIMVGTGSILWAVKRSKKQMGQVGFELVRGLNIGSIAGLFCACGSYFWSNRIIPTELANRELWEIRTFFIVWAICLIAGLIWRDRKSWLVQLVIAAVLFTLIPVLDNLTSPVGIISAIQTQDWFRLSFNLVALTLAATLWLAVYYMLVVKPRQGRNTQSKTIRQPNRKLKIEVNH